jgi:peptidyl-prolyl cis-trans isomerase C
MKRIFLSLIILFCALISAFGCARKPSEDDKVLANVSNKTVTLRDFKERVAKLPPYYKNVVDRNKKRFLDETIVEMMFYEEAIRRGLDSDKEVKEILREAKKKILIAKLIKIEVEDKVKVDEAEKRHFYEANKDKFKAPELWRASHILVDTHKEAEDVLAELTKGADFAELAKARSKDATASRGGDVGYFRKAQVVAEFENACMQLRVGELSGIVHSQFGYHIIKLTDKKESGTQSYDEVKRFIEDELKKEKRSELFDKLVLNLKNKYNVEIQDDVFRSLEAMDKKKEGAVK